MIVDQPIDNPAANVPPPQMEAPAPVAQPSFTWKGNLGADIANSPTMQKFPDTKEGLIESARSYLNLEKLLGHEKIPVPKSKDDAEGWAIYSKAFGIPDKPEGYNLEDAKIPEHLKGLSFDKNKFSEIAHANKLTPDQTKTLWATYTQLQTQGYEQAVKAHQEKMTGIVNQLRAEWGDAYQTKVELGQMVINKFADSKETADALTALFTQDPNSIKFLAKIGDQFAENKVGEFSAKRYSLTSEEAQREIDGIRQDPKHPYNNDRCTPAERDRAVDYVNSLLSVVSKAKTKGQA